MLFKKGFLISILLSFTQLAYSLGYQSGTIEELLVHYPIGSTDGYYIVRLNGTRYDTAPEACNTYANTWAGDMSLEVGKAQYSTLLAAFMANKTVRIDTNSACLIGREMVRNVRLFAN